MIGASVTPHPDPGLWRRSTALHGLFRWLLIMALIAAVGVVAAEPSRAQAAPDPCAGMPRAAFDDVSDGSVHARGIDCLVWHRLTLGRTTFRYGATAALQRGQLATLLDRAITLVDAPLRDPVTRRFVDTNGVHGQAIERLAHAGIVQGVTATLFAPESPLYRDQLAAMVVRAHERLDGSLPSPAPHPFTDIDGNLHATQIGQAVALGLVVGTTSTTYAPRQPVSRAEVATVFARWLKRLAADGVATGLPAAGYAARIEPLPADLRRLVEATTWRAGCPVGPSDLRSLSLVHTDLGGRQRWGRLIVHRSVANDVATAFGRLHRDGFRIARIVPIERYRGDDDASMAANNTSAFNCRRVTGSTSWSEHSYGRAIDINPVQNPYVRGSTVLPSAGRAYLDRSNIRPGMLARGHGVEAFTALGWGWGGDWNTLKDYQHVSSTGR
jgi:hypothetical protein